MAFLVGVAFAAVVALRVALAVFAGGVALLRGGSVSSWLGG
ncbi:hypothetical protein [Virgisporangium aliadipatigenens]|nr:hypothetical protein [Virgisporangium aliadipatigenens]